MIAPPKFEPADASEVPGPDLFMTVIKVQDWEGVLSWYVETLGLLLMLRDEAHRFALLAAGSGRLGLQGAREPISPDSVNSARLVFVVPDVETERTRLAERGVEVGPVVEHPGERYREVRLRDPAGTPLTLFSWTNAGQSPRRDASSG